MLGLGHSSNSTSVMFATLAAGTTNRALVSADLNVPDSDSGPCALQAALTAAVNATSNGPGMIAPSSTSVPSSGNSRRAQRHLPSNRCGAVRFGPLRRPRTLEVIGERSRFVAMAHGVLEKKRVGEAAG
jgi:hypothetical protein